MDIFTENKAIELLNLLKVKGVIIEQGLSENEILSVENAYGAQLPPDFKIFLQAGVMKSKPSKEGEHSAYFPDWRNPLQEAKRCRDWIERAFRFDILNSDYWNAQLGKRPENLEKAVSQALGIINSWPVLFPVFSHRFIPSDPNSSGNPILSLWQASDTVYYGANLEDYLNQEFKLGLAIEQQPIKHIPYWADAFEL